MTERDEQREGVKGAVEDLKGKAKETAGTFLGNDTLEREGKAQQDKAGAQQEIADKEAEARRAREEAAAAESRERREQ
ncbi:CsbD family protein [Amycolatopsis anabasis]|uniref:microaggregate-binding protein 1 n=1 Tax=Amycolatopsis anabasis TaxID=1840409 RepID=UPI00131E8C9F|nr:CsbD family protein [Amycolatopsis anabasis]